VATARRKYNGRDGSRHEVAGKYDNLNPLASFGNKAVPYNWFPPPNKRSQSAIKEKKTSKKILSRATLLFLFPKK